jgi:chloramphenicol 3-O phosphotransferase
VFLNGTSSAGKTSIAKALQEVMERPFLHTGVDHFLAGVPKQCYVYSDGVNPASADGWLLPFKDSRLAEVPRIGPVGLRILTGMYHAIAGFAEVGNDVIVDDVLYDERVLAAAVEALAGFPVLFVGVRCPREVAVQREQERGDRAGGAAIFHDYVHRHGIYDLEVDSSVLTPMESALLIKEALENGHPRTAFRRLASVPAII